MSNGSNRSLGGTGRTGLTGRRPTTATVPNHSRQQCSVPHSWWESRVSCCARRGVVAGQKNGPTATPFRGRCRAGLVWSSAHRVGRWDGSGQHLGTGSRSVDRALLAVFRRLPDAELTMRKPRLLLRFVGVLLLRCATRAFVAVLFHEPPRITRFASFYDPPMWFLASASFAFRSKNPRRIR